MILDERDNTEYAVWEIKKRPDVKHIRASVFLLADTVDGHIHSLIFSPCTCPDFLYVASDNAYFCLLHPNPGPVHGEFPGDFPHS